MEKVSLIGIKKQDKKIYYDFEISDGLKNYFSGKPFIIEYTENVEQVPEGVLAIPFVCNVLPIIWMTKSKLELNELDEEFFKCIEEVKKGYEKVFPGVNFGGCVEPVNVVNYSYKNTDKCAMFYSGGLDSVQTFVSHIKERPDLISIWGSDIKFDNKKGWDTLHNVIGSTAKKYGLKDVVIHSSFREFDNEGVLHREFFNILQDGWWHGIKHSLGLLGHVAPYVWLNKISTMYIASSYWDDGTIIKCASSPYTDNYVKFCGCKVVHDGFEFNRQDKVTNVVNYVKSTGDQVELHVCWETQTGGNCCECEKCYRTMAGLWAEGEDPANYGFERASETLKKMKKNLFRKEFNLESVSTFGPIIQKRANQNLALIKTKPYFRKFKWVLNFDFEKAVKKRRNSLKRAKWSPCRIVRAIKRRLLKKKK